MPYPLPAGGVPLDVSSATLDLGPWCCSAPVWTNPLLPASAQPSGAGGLGSCLEDVFGALQVIPSLRTVGDVCRIHDALSAAMSACSQRGLMGDACARVCNTDVWIPELQLAGLAFMPGDVMMLVGDRSPERRTLELIQQLHDAVPAA